MLLRNCRQFKSVTPHALRARFARNEGGAIAPIFAASITVLVLAVAIAMELGRWVIAQNHLQMSLDAAVLSGASQLRANPADEGGAMKAARRVYALNMSKSPFSDDVVGPVDFEINGTMVKAVGQPRLQTILSDVVKRASLPLASDSKASFGIGGGTFEVALMLDVTDSMSGTAITALKSAATKLVETTLSSANSRNRIALVPFADGVRLTRELQDKAIGVRPAWQNGYHVTSCVSERGGNDAYTDAAPGPGKYLLPVRIKYSARHTVGVCSLGDEDIVVPLTNNKQKLVDVIDGLQVGGHTAGHLGTAWAWYTLSPKWKGFWGDSAADALPYENTGVRKVAILMTDGHFNRQFDEDGFKTKRTTDAVNGTSDDQTLALCRNMKAAGIEIYTVGFDLSDDARETIRQCASSADHAYEPESGEELVRVYETIGQTWQTLYLAE